MKSEFMARVHATLEEIEANGLAKIERVIHSVQGGDIEILRDDGTRGHALNFCANDYLGLAAHPRVVEAAREAASRWGAGVASVRFICGTQAIHKELEAVIAEYLGYEDAILFAACFDANAAVFEPLFGEEDAIISDRLNHASIIDGIRLTKAKRYPFANNDMDDLERQLKSARANRARSVIIATDGVFSMDGHVANLASITSLADRYGALVMVDDCHATGHLGPHGRGSAALCGVTQGVDLLTGTFGKTLGGAMGGFICGSRTVIALLRQRARPYLFSNSLAPAPCGAALEAVSIVRSDEGDRLRARLEANCRSFREGMTAGGFDLKAGNTPIMPVMVGDARRAQNMAAKLLDHGIYATAFSYPVVPNGTARIRIQLSAAHTPDQIQRAVDAFAAIRIEMDGGAGEKR